MSAYYNEFKPEAAHMLRQLIKDGIIAPGEVDERSITEVKADDLKGFTQCHFFAGIGGWSAALRIASWDDARSVWTGSCPCQPFSSIGEQRGGQDERHLWPIWFSLIKECRPPKIFGEQVARAISHGWLDGVCSNMESEGYAIGSAVLPACSVNAPHKRDRCWFVADREERERLQRNENNSEWPNGKAWEVDSRNSRLNNAPMEYGLGERSQGLFRDDCGEEGRKESPRSAPSAGFWSDYEWITCADGFIRRIPSASSGIRVVGHGIQHRAPLFHALGNAIVPEVATRFIQACM